MGMHIYRGIQTHLLRILIHQLEALILASSIRLARENRHYQPPAELPCTFFIISRGGRIDFSFGC